MIEKISKKSLKKHVDKSILDTNYTLICNKINEVIEAITYKQLPVDKKINIALRSNETGLIYYTKETGYTIKTLPIIIQDNPKYEKILAQQINNVPFKAESVTGEKIAENTLTNAHFAEGCLITQHFHTHCLTPELFSYGMPFAKDNITLKSELFKNKSIHRRSFKKEDFLKKEYQTLSIKPFMQHIPTTYTTQTTKQYICLTDDIISLGFECYIEGIYSTEEEDIDQSEPLFTFEGAELFEEDKFTKLFFIQQAYFSLLQVNEEAQTIRIKCIVPFFVNVSLNYTINYADKFYFMKDNLQCQVTINKVSFLWTVYKNRELKYEDINLGNNNIIMEEEVTEEQISKKYSKDIISEEGKNISQQYKEIEKPEEKIIQYSHVLHNEQEKYETQISLKKDINNENIDVNEKIYEKKSKIQTPKITTEISTDIKKNFEQEIQEIKQEEGEDQQENNIKINEERIIISEKPGAQDAQTQTIPFKEKKETGELVYEGSNFSIEISPPLNAEEKKTKVIFQQSQHQVITYESEEKKDEDLQIQEKNISFTVNGIVKKTEEISTQMINEENLEINRAQLSIIVPTITKTEIQDIHMPIKQINEEAQTEEYQQNFVKHIHDLISQRITASDLIQVPEKPIQISKQDEIGLNNFYKVVNIDKDKSVRQSQGIYSPQRTIKIIEEEEEVNADNNNLDQQYAKSVDNEDAEKIYQNLLDIAYAKNEYVKVLVDDKTNKEQEEKQARLKAIAKKIQDEIRAEEEATKKIRENIEQMEEEEALILREKINQIDEENLALDIAIEEEQKIKDEIDAELQTLSDKLTAIEYEADLTKEELESAQAQEEMLKGYYEDLQNQYNEEKERIEREKRELEEQTAEIKKNNAITEQTLNTQLQEELQKNYEALIQTFQEKQNEILKISYSINQKRQAITEMELKIEELKQKQAEQQEIEKITEEKQQIITEKAIKEGELQEKEAEKQEIIIRKKQTENNIIKARTEIKESRQKQKISIPDQNVKLTELKTELGQAQKERETVKKKIDKTKAKIDIQDEKIKKIKKKKNDLIAIKEGEYSSEDTSKLLNEKEKQYTKAITNFAELMKRIYTKTILKTLQREQINNMSILTKKIEHIKSDKIEHAEEKTQKDKDKKHKAKQKLKQNQNAKIENNIESANNQKQQKNTKKKIKINNLVDKMQELNNLKTQQKQLEANNIKIDEEMQKDNVQSFIATKESQLIIKKVEMTTIQKKLYDEIEKMKKEEDIITPVLTNETLQILNNPPKDEQDLQIFNEFIQTVTNVLQRRVENGHIDLEPVEEEIIKALGTVEPEQSISLFKILSRKQKEILKKEVSLSNISEEENSNIILFEKNIKAKEKTILDAFIPITEDEQKILANITTPELREQVTIWYEDIRKKIIDDIKKSINDFHNVWNPKDVQTIQKYQQQLIEKVVQGKITHTEQITSTEEYNNLLNTMEGRTNYYKRILTLLDKTEKDIISQDVHYTPYLEKLINLYNTTRHVINTPINLDTNMKIIREEEKKLSSLSQIYIQGTKEKNIYTEKRDANILETDAQTVEKIKKNTYLKHLLAEKGEDLKPLNKHFADLWNKGSLGKVTKSSLKTLLIQQNLQKNKLFSIYDQYIAENKKVFIDVPKRQLKNIYADMQKIGKNLKVENAQERENLVKNNDVVKNQKDFFPAKITLRAVPEKIRAWKESIIIGETENEYKHTYYTDIGSATVIFNAIAYETLDGKQRVTSAGMTSEPVLSESMYRISLDPQIIFPRKVFLYDNYDALNNPNNPNNPDNSYMINIIGDTILTKDELGTDIFCNLFYPPVIEKEIFSFWRAEFKNVIYNSVDRFMKYLKIIDEFLHYSGIYRLRSILELIEHYRQVFIKQGEINFREQLISALEFLYSQEGLEEFFTPDNENLTPEQKKYIEAVRTSLEKSLKSAYGVDLELRQIFALIVGKWVKDFKHLAEKGVSTTNYFPNQQYQTKTARYDFKIDKTVPDQIIPILKKAVWYDFGLKQVIYTLGMQLQVIPLYGKDYLTVVDRFDAEPPANDDPFWGPIIGGAAGGMVAGAVGATALGSIPIVGTFVALGSIANMLLQEDAPKIPWVKVNIKITNLNIIDARLVVPEKMPEEVYDKINDTMITVYGITALGFTPLQIDNENNEMDKTMLSDVSVTVQPGEEHTKEEPSLALKAIDGDASTVYASKDTIDDAGKILYLYPPKKDSGTIVLIPWGEDLWTALDKEITVFGWIRNNVQNIQQQKTQNFIADENDLFEGGNLSKLF